jgi:hypothetical protein
MNTPTVPTIANVILAQLGGAGRLTAMIGARDFLDCGNALAFRFTARSLRAINRIRVELAPDDTYTVTFYRGRLAIVVQTITGVYADGLRETIEHATGLYLSL